ncbi:hypothetical protein, partial [uncultured Kiloniella sp.]|uniref:hypothetical protein n=1 Tax=uncultured Kiloniella sp. TaxID=1133091 RepID=UPI002632E075
MATRWTTTRIIWMMIVATILTFVMVLGTLLWSAYLSNRQAALDSVALAKGGLDEFASQVCGTDIASLQQPAELSLFIVEPDLPTAAWLAQPIPDNLEQQVRAAVQSSGTETVVEFFGLIEGEVHFFVAQIKYPNALLGKSLDPVTVAGLGATFLLSNLHLADMPVAHEARLPLIDGNGAIMGYLA